MNKSILDIKQIKDIWQRLLNMGFMERIRGLVVGLTHWSDIRGCP